MERTTHENAQMSKVAEYKHKKHSTKLKVIINNTANGVGHERGAYYCISPSLEYSN